MAMLAAPALGALRLASPNDILRIGIVAACGFRYSPVFTWERPYHTSYPADTLLSYRQEFSDIIKNPEYIVLVAIDKFDPDEGKKSEAIIPPDDGAEVPSPNAEVVVGVGAWKLQSGSSRVGHFQNDTGTIATPNPFLLFVAINLSFLQASIHIYPRTSIETKIPIMRKDGARPLKQQSKSTKKPPLVMFVFFLTLP